MNMLLMEKTVLITGASKGIGEQTAYKFAEAGFNLILSYNKDEKNAKRITEKCKSLGSSNIMVFQLDLTSEKSIKSTFKKVSEKYKNIDILINNAGVVIWKPLKKQTFKEIDSQININILGLIKLTKLFLPIIKSSIINISSTAGKTGYEELVPYCASKFGVRGFTQALSKETSLLILSINPGMTSTQMTNFQGVSPEKVADIIFRASLNKYNKPSGSDIDVPEYL